MATIRRMQQANARPDTSEQIAERRRYAKVKAIVDAERAERWPELTVENFEDVIAWQESRIRSLLEGED